MATASAVITSGEETAEITVAAITGTRTEEMGSVTITGAGRTITVAVIPVIRMEETGSATITGTDRITTREGRIMTAGMGGVITEETAAMAASVYLNGLRRPRVVLMASSRSKRVPARGIRRRMTEIKRVDTARVLRRR